MTRLVSLQMISLLIFNDHVPPAAARSSSRCVSVEQVDVAVRRFQRTYWDRLRFFKNLQDTRARAQAATVTRGGLNNRSLSPWKYNLNTEDNRFPYEIPFAECLHHGCIINQREDMSYNSVPVFASLMVLRKTRCPQDTDKYLVTRDFINVPVACTCAVPKYTK